MLDSIQFLDDVLRLTYTKLYTLFLMQPQPCYIQGNCHWCLSEGLLRKPNSTGFKSFFFFFSVRKHNALTFSGWSIFIFDFEITSCFAFFFFFDNTLYPLDMCMASRLERSILWFEQLHRYSLLYFHSPAYCQPDCHLQALSLLYYLLYYLLLLYFLLINFAVAQTT